MLHNSPLTPVFIILSCFVSSGNLKTEYNFHDFYRDVQEEFSYTILEVWLETIRVYLNLTDFTKLHKTETSSAQTSPCSRFYKLHPTFYFHTLTLNNEIGSRAGFDNAYITTMYKKLKSFSFVTFF